MTKIFISYRRSDAQDVTGRIYDRLASVFRSENVFKDVDSIEPGEHFDSVVRKSIREADAVVVVIGPSWATVTNRDGGRRLEDPEDLVRIEVECALDCNRRVIPVLVGNATMPSRDVLPRSIQPLTDLNAVAVRPDPDFSGDVKRLIHALGQRTMAISSRPVLGGILFVGLLSLVSLGVYLATRGNPPPLTDETDTPPIVQVTAAETQTSAARVMEVLYEQRPDHADDQQTPMKLEILGEFQPLGEDTFYELNRQSRLRSASDGYRFKLRTPEPGYLYVFQVDASGRVDWLFPANPSSPYSNGKNPTEPGLELSVPADGGLLTLDRTAGAEQVYFVFSRTPWPALEGALTSSVEQMPTHRTVSEPFATRFRGVGGISVGGRIQELSGPPESSAMPEWREYEGVGDFFWIQKSFYHVD